MSGFADSCKKVEEYLERRGIRVVTRDVPDPLLGDLDGVEIHVDQAVSDEHRLFLLAHLFGHTVQWNTDPRAVEVGRLHRPPVPEELLAAVLSYEREAASLALGMLHETGVTGLDQWLSDFTACDLAYLEHYYRTGGVGEFRSFWKDGTGRIQARRVPRFVAERRRLRGDGVVI